MNAVKIAAVDIGSNAVRLLINDVYENNGNTIFNKVTLIRVPIRLGKDVFSVGKISGYNINRLSDTLNSFKLLLGVYQVNDYIVCATSALREAENGNEVIDIIKERTGVNIELISGKKEAELILNFKLEQLFEPNKNYLFVDVGGGSTDICFYNQKNKNISASFKVGTVRSLEGKVSKNETKKLKDWVQEITKGIDIELIGSGGNINHVRRRFFEKEPDKITTQELDSIYQEIKKYSIQDRITKFGMNPDRADVIEPALEIYTSIANWADAKIIHIPKIGVADSLIQYLYKKLKK
ncbi:MAG: exopolyphosphatase [Solirubrobacteraceae bacterium]